ncbi:putative aldouronate transport system permease protein [Paenibacillus sp. UNC496MF]|uniref:carbohydrate ABC transporter permease n=1 Tax=Paenibacillus sp. UNC496MF TaxID=1502753 RepID=UPI0008E144EB|nr:carbohydrate ABC transporter permease [Paenibacillus sp. UNC496MF]SFJ91491.1 putative aldouronate transport system permease protein [Paenibacillus sp. UNC496MF]
MTAAGRNRMTWMDYVNYTVLALFCVSILYPIIYLTCLSLSTREGLASGGASATVLLWPQGFTTEAYEAFFKTSYIYTGYLYTMGRTAVGTVAGVLLMSLAAYALSKKIPMKKSLTMYFIFTMFFSGGLIPTFILIKNLGLLNNPLVYVLAPPFLYNTFYILILRNFFMTVPESLEESAKMDGAGDLRIFSRIIMPLSAPVIATISLWVAVAHWNSWFDSLIYMQSMDKQVIQVLIRKLVIEQSQLLMNETMGFANMDSVPTAESVKAAGILITMIPIVCIYPFIQKYFVKGVVIGAVKG